MVTEKQKHLDDETHSTQISDFYNSILGIPHKKGTIIQFERIFRNCILPQGPQATPLRLY